MNECVIEEIKMKHLKHALAAISFDMQKTALYQHSHSW